MTAQNAITRNLHPAFIVVLGALILLLPTWLNGFPFVYPDSTDYLTIHPQLHRLPFYGTLIHVFHWNRFIWAPIIMQCLVASQLLWLLMRLVTGDARPHIYLPFMVAMAALTSLPYFTGFLFADIFTPFMFLSFIILCFYHRSLSGWMLYYLFVLTCIAIVTHISNLTLGFGLCILLTLLLALTRTPWHEGRRALLLVSMPMLLAASAIMLCNGLVLKTWSLTPAGKSFFMANMIEYGPTRDYLNEACPTIHYRICRFRPYPETANELLWNDNSIFWQLGGFAGMRDESAQIVHETIRTRPRDVAWMVWDNFRAGLITHAPAAEFYGRYQIRPFSLLLRNKFGVATQKEYKASAEMHETLPYETLKIIDDIVTPCSFFILLITAAMNIRTRNMAFTLSISTLCFVLGDTLLCTALSGVFDRYQARVTWLMPMLVGLLLIDYLKKRRTV